MEHISTEAKVLETLAAFPEGLSAGELKSLFPDLRANGVHASLYVLVKGECARILKERPIPQPAPRKTEKIYVATGRSYADRVRLTSKKSKPAKPTQVAIDARLDSAMAKIAELEAWKTDAIRRFPDLAVEPAIIAARKRVAAILRETGDTTGADQVMRGNRDHTPIVKAVAGTIRDLA